MTADDLADPENWRGGFYELAILLGPANDERVEAATRVVWSTPGVEGPEASPRAGGGASHPHSASLREGHERGTATLPSGIRVVCGLLLIREEDSGLDWLDFYLPLGAVGRADARVGAFPFGGPADGSLAWRREIDTWLAAIGERIHRAAPFEYALVGFEVSGEDPPNESARDRWVGVLRPDGQGLVYLPPTQG